MQQNTQLLKQVLAMVLIALVGGTVGYRIIEQDWTLLDSFYMTFITLTTIGFGEVHELSPNGRMFTIVLVVFGLGAAATFAAHFATMVLEGNILEYWRKRHMERKLAKIQDHVIVCGFGRIGQSICSELTGLGATCIVIENDDNKQELARRSGYPVVSGNATNDIALISAGVRSAAAIVAALSHDTDNVFIALSARDLNPDVMIIARAENNMLESRFIKAGVNRIVYPSQLGGSKIAHLVGEQIGLETESETHRRAADVLGYDLEIYRNICKSSRTLESILLETGVQKALAVVRHDGTHESVLTSETMVEEMEAVVLLVDGNIAKQENSHTSLPETNWQNLSVGFSVIDDEHQKILSLISRLEMADPKSENRVIHEVLEDLLKYTVNHFSHEESIFLASDYPHAEMHMAEHKAMIQKVQMLIEDKAHVHPANLARLLNGWITHHILEVDHGYIEYLSLQTTS